MARRLVVLVALGSSLAMSAACGAVEAKTPADDAPLSTPAAPPRVVVPVTIDTPALQEPPKPAGRETAAKPAATSVTPPVTTPPVAAPPPSQADPPTPVLQTQTTANVTEAEKRVRGVIFKALTDLSRVDYRSLSADSKAQYDQAKRFIEQAESAVKVKNVVFAEQLAGKAATLASSLIKRRFSSTSS